MIELALATAAISMTLTKSSLFNWLQVTKLTQCPYCMAHWIALILVCGTWEGHLGDLAIYSFAVVALSVVPMYIINAFMEKIDEAVHDSQSVPL